MAEVIVALDRPSAESAFDLVDRLGSGADYYKVGMELFGRAGPAFVESLRSRGKRIFLDLKYHDIPNTVRGAVEAAAALEVELVTIHAGGGSGMIRAAVDAAGARTRVVAVTVLTSLDTRDLSIAWKRDVGSVEDEVVRLAAHAVTSGAHGVVASAREASALRRALGQAALIVTPGIRLAGGEQGDQKRVATPTDAVRAGATHLVVGRAVTAAPDPAGALSRVLSEVSAAARQP